MQKKSTWIVQTSNKADVVWVTRSCVAFGKVGGGQVGEVECSHHPMVSAKHELIMGV